MSQAASTSPFSAATRQERQAQWLLWQRQSVETGSALHTPEPPPPPPSPAPEPPLTAAAALQHRRYDAVVQRMQNARKQAGSYSTWA